jgi:sec-independent protein translocase protein TatA
MFHAAFWGSWGSTELLILLGVVLLIFGGRKLPELARALGRSITEFRRGIQEVGDEFKDAAETKPLEQPEDADTTLQSGSPDSQESAGETERTGDGS